MSTAYERKRDRRSRKAGVGKQECISLGFVFVMTTREGWTVREKPLQIIPQIPGRSVAVVGIALHALDENAIQVAWNGPIRATRTS
jgi:hypothetical protein